MLWFETLHQLFIKGLFIEQSLDKGWLRQNVEECFGLITIGVLPDGEDSHEKSTKAFLCREPTSKESIQIVRAARFGTITFDLNTVERSSYCSTGILKQ